MATEAQLKAQVQVALTLLEAIRNAGTAGVPSGHLYAALMGVLNLDQYNALLGALKKQGLVKEQHHLLTYSGPK